ncbi:MAG: oligopeptide/dipeptide ABC transporter ATP-binding protein [Pseudomonadota bacterium]
MSPAAGRARRRRRRAGCAVSTESLLSVRDVTVDYATGRGRLRAVDRVSFELGAGEALGLVGESGCGKSTLGRALLRLVPLAGGEVRWQGRDLARLRRDELRRLRADQPILYQDPPASLDPRLPIGHSDAEPLEVHRPELGRTAVRERVGRMLARVGLGPELHNRYPHEFSGGQCQRVGIARAMILEPKLGVCDEPVSALDVSVQGQIVELLRELRRDHGTALVFISHNLAVVRRLCERVLVMYLGRTMEFAPSEEFYADPLHPYSRLLLDAVPVPDPRVERARPPLAAGEVASPFAPPSGCVFRTRCPVAVEACARDVPAFEAATGSRRVACLRWGDRVTARR